MLAGPDPDGLAGMERPPETGARAASNAGAKARRSTPSSVESAPMPMTRSAVPGASQLAESLDELEAGRRPVGAIDVTDQLQRTPVSASALAIPSSRPATIAPRSWPAAR